LSGGEIEQWAAKRLGRAALIDFVRSTSHEARVAYPRLLENVLSQADGRLVWAGSIDQQLVGHDLAHFEDILISEFPSAEACGRALALRRGWQPETILNELISHIVQPWPSFGPMLAGVAFAAARLLRAGRRIGRSEDDAATDRVALLGHMRPDLGPDEAQLARLQASQREGRVVMVNLLHYLDRAQYRPDDRVTEDRSGEQAYRRYGRTAVPMIAGLGGRLRWMGSRMRCLADDRDERWDSVAVVQYPSREAFRCMLESERYRRATHHRDAGLARTRLLVCTSHAEFH